MLVVLAVVVGLLAAAPAACWCPADDHFGQLLHPRFDHQHPSDTEASFGHADTDSASSMDAPVEPAWATAGALGMSRWQAGVQILPPLLAAALLDAWGPRLSFEIALPTQYVPSMVRPPPR